MREVTTKWYNPYFTLSSRYFFFYLHLWSLYWAVRHWLWPLRLVRGRGRDTLRCVLIPSENYNKFWHDGGVVWGERTFETILLSLEKEIVLQNKLTISKITSRNWGWADEPKPTHKWALMIYFKPTSDIITLASLFTSWEECRNPTSIFSSLFNFSRSLGTLHKTASECEYIFSQLLFPTFNTSPLTASGSISFPWRKKKKERERDC
jgi:hypothetical protein